MASEEARHKNYARRAAPGGYSPEALRHRSARCRPNRKKAVGASPSTARWPSTSADDLAVATDCQALFARNLVVAPFFIEPREHAPRPRRLAQVGHQLLRPRR